MLFGLRVYTGWICLIRTPVMSGSNDVLNDEISLDSFQNTSSVRTTRDSLHLSTRNKLWPVMSAVIAGKNYFVTKMDRYNKYQTKHCTHAHTYTHNIRWLVLGWMTTKEDHPRQRVAYTSYIWRVIKFYLLTYSPTYLFYVLNLPVCTGRSSSLEWSHPVNSPHHLTDERRVYTW